MPDKKITAAIIALDEEENIQSCLETVRWADEIVVVDGGSRDQTAALARMYTPNVYTVPFADFSAQKNEAIRRATGDWVFVLDADERVSHALAGEIRGRCGTDAEAPAIYAVKRDNHFFGRPLRFSGAQDDYQPRLFPRGGAHFEQPVHERLVSPLPVVRLKNRLVHYGTRDLAHYRQKLDRYVALEMRAMSGSARRVRPWDVCLRPAGQFLFLYFWKWGILDGLTGLEFALLSAYYTFFKWRRFRQITGCPAPDAGGT